jgi:arginine decarboxylase
MADCLHLQHFHLGSQIANILQIKGAVNEAARMYVDPARVGAGLRYFDVGVGLGIIMTAPRPISSRAFNYTLQAYANDVIYHVMNVCHEAQVPHAVQVLRAGDAAAARRGVGVAGRPDRVVLRGRAARVYVPGDGVARKNCL